MLQWNRSFSDKLYLKWGSNWCDGVFRFAVTAYARRRAVGSSPKFVWKKTVRWIQNNLKNIICYSCYESNKSGKCHTFLVSFIIPLSWPEWFMSCFVTRCKIFSKITHQTTLREARTNTAPFFSEVGRTKFVLASELFVLRPYFIRDLTAKKPARIWRLLLQFIFRGG